ncbi:MAG: hypothetical protein ACXWH0_10665, partial [Acidimicrobiia bacterium]
LFEAYYAYDTVVEAGSRLWWSFAPISLIGLLMLEVVEIPLAWSMARWLRERQREREVFSSRRSRRQTSNVGA